MEGISSFVLAFCVGCVVIGAIGLIVPSGSLQKPLKYISCLAFLCIVLGGVLSIRGIDFDMESGEQPTLEHSSAETLARQTFAEALRLKNIEFDKIEVFTDKSDEGGIFITEVVVYTKASYESVKEIISSDGAYNVRVINE
ncbi:MAG: hypothetical protein IJZ75_00110 [Clostridia bacterium]|nr:hypothetical protein [Clostridia bacterium]